MPTPHNPSLGIFCTCPACIIARADVHEAHRRDLAAREAHDPSLDSDYDLIGSYRRYQWGE